MSSPLRVCHVSISLSTGGLERVIAELAKHHNRNEFDLSFAPLKSEGRFAEKIRHLQLDVHKVESRSMLDGWKKLAKFFRNHRIEIVHSHNTYPAIHATMAAKMAGVPMIVNTRHGQRSGHGWKSRIQFRLACHFMDRIIAVSDDAAHMTTHVDKIPCSKVVRIWNGIDLSDFSFRGGVLEPVVISVGRLVPEKDYATLIRSVVIAKKSAPEIQLKIVGDGPLRGELQSLIQELDAVSYIELLGEREDVAEILSKAGLYVSSSLSEGISLTILEAMAIGLPVIATAVGGNVEIVNCPSVGWTTEPQNPQNMASVLLAAIQAKSSWKSISERGRRRVESHFSAPLMTQQYESLYRNLAMEKQLTHRTTLPTVVPLR